MKVAPVVPARLHGFAVRVGLGPYPPDAEGSHRRAMYAELLPLARSARARMRALGRERILGVAPLTARAAREIAAEPSGRVAEQAAKAALAEASALARGLGDPPA